MHIFSCERTILQEETKLRPAATIPSQHLPFPQLSSPDNQILWAEAPGILSNRKHRFGPGLASSQSCLHSFCERDPMRVISRKARCGCPSSRQHQICLHVADQPHRLRTQEETTYREKASTLQPALGSLPHPAS